MEQEISQKSQIFEKLGKNFTIFLVTCSIVIIIVTCTTTFLLLERYVFEATKKKIDQEKNTFIFLKTEESLETANNYLNYLYKKNQIDLGIYYDKTTQTITASTNPKYLGKTLNELPNEHVQMSISSALERKTDEFDVFYHMNNFDAIYYFDGNVVMFHIPIELSFSRLVVSSFIAEVIELILVLIILIIPIIFFFKYILKKLHIYITHVSSITPFNISNFKLEQPSQEKGKSYLWNIKTDLMNIERNERWIFSIIDQLPVGLFFSNLKGEALYVNRKTAELLGLSQIMSKGSGWSNSLYKDDKSEIIEKWKNFVSKPSYFDEEFRFQHPNGKIIWVKTVAISLSSPEGEVIGFMGSIIPIDRIKEAEIELTKRKRQLEFAMIGANLGIWDWDILSGAVYYSDQWSTMLGYDPKELPNTFDTWLNLLHPEDYDRALTALNAHIEGKNDFYEAKFRLRAKDGSWRWILSRGKVFERTKDGQAIRASGTHVDLTESMENQKKAENLASIVNSSNDAIISQDTNQHIQSWNEEAQRLFGYFFEEVEGKDSNFIFNESDLPKISEMIEKVKHEEKVELLEVSCKKKNNELFPCFISVSPIYSINDKIEGVSLIIRDIKAIEEAREKEAKITAIKSELISMVSHDIRTPLSVIKECLSIISSRIDQLDEEQKKFINIANLNVEKLSTLVHDVLDYQSLESGKTEFVMKDCDINQSVKQCMDSLKIQADSKGLCFEAKLDHQLPIIYGDCDRILEVITNLVSNALKFTEKGSITIETSHDQQHVYIKVIDTGIGIEQYDHARLFETFTQIHQQYSKSGSGLGLAICKKIIDYHQGSIQVESKPGKGSTFTVKLPIKGQANG